MNQTVIHRDPEIQGGTPVFVGTRVPLKNLFDCLEAGESLDQFKARCIDMLPALECGVITFR